MKNKKRLIVLLLAMATIIQILGGKVEAALQSNGTSPATKNLGNWLAEIRQMEASGGTLGLSDTINSTSLVSTGTSNNLDIHMEKNTEYGAMAILSASGYGNPQKIVDGGTTTGNKSGIVINLNKEWVSAGTLSDCEQYSNVNNKYKNIYTSNYVAKRGDAIDETVKWHESGANTWLDRNDISGLIRAYSGSVFSYYGYSDGTYHYGPNRVFYYDAYHTNNWASRACIVVGNGF